MDLPDEALEIILLSSDVEVLINLLQTNKNINQFINNPYILKKLSILYNVPTIYNLKEIREFNKLTRNEKLSIASERYNMDYILRILSVDDVGYTKALILTIKSSFINASFFLLGGTDNKPYEIEIIGNEETSEGSDITPRTPFAFVRTKDLFNIILGAKYNNNIYRIVSAHKLYKDSFSNACINLVHVFNRKNSQFREFILEKKNKWCMTHNNDEPTLDIEKLIQEF